MQTFGVDQGIQTLSVGTPWGCQTQMQGVSDSFPGSNTKNRNLVFAWPYKQWSSSLKFR